MRHLIPFILAAAGCAGAPPRPTPPGLPSPVNSVPERAVRLAAGAMHTCALYADGHVSCWGSNRNGQLGQALEASVDASWSPLRVQSIEEVTRVASGYRHTCALNVLGEVWCWGANDQRQLGDGTTASRATPTRVPLPGTAQALRANGSRTCAITLEDASRAWCWGDGEGVAEVSTPEHKAATMRMWRLDPLGQPLRVGEEQPVMRLPTNGRVTRGALFVELVEGARHACMRTRDGAVWCAGDNDEGQLGVGDRRRAAAESPTELPRLTCPSVEYLRGSRYCGMTSPYLDDASGPSRHGTFHADPSPRMWRHGPAIEVDPKSGQIVAMGRYDRGVRSGSWKTATPDGRLRGRGDLTGDLDARVGHWEFTMGEERQWGRYGLHHRPTGEWNWARVDGHFTGVFDDEGAQKEWTLVTHEQHDYEVELSGSNVHLRSGRPTQGGGGRGWGGYLSLSMVGRPEPWTPGVAASDRDAFDYAFPLIEYVKEALDIEEEEVE